MAASSLECRELFAQAVKSCKGDVEVLQSVFNEAPGIEADKKSILEQAFRDALRDKLRSLKPSRLDTLNRLILLANASAEQGISLYAVPFILLGDIFDCITLDACEQVFSFVESHVSTWVQPEFYAAGKILLLRMCNDLLRRLSSAQNTVFCGRIQLFLAQLFPLSEKSALNLMSHFNLDNVTSFCDEDRSSSSSSLRAAPGKAKGAGGRKAESEEGQQEATPMEIDSGGAGDGGNRSNMSFDSTDTNAPVDYNLYRKLWSLQDFFRQPTQCYSQDHWKTVTGNMEEVLKAFASYKLQEEVVATARSSGLTTSSSSSGAAGGKKKHRGGRTGSVSTPTSSRAVPSVQDHQESHYFAKFLTSEKLMNLQLHDAHFRRHLLLQCLILFQYLTSDVKFKATSLVLTDAQALWIADMQEKVYALLNETPPNGAEFAVYIRQVLAREKCWIAWKNDGCPSYEKEPAPPSEERPALKHLGDPASKKIDIGNAELSRLWNLCPDNLQACKQSGRVFRPEKASFLEEAMDQADPEARIETEFKVVNNTNYSWQALRLLSATSSHFFQNTTAAIRPIPDYLEHVVLQEAKDLQQQQQLQQQQVSQANSEAVNGSTSSSS